MIINLNMLTTYMENNEASLEDALAFYNYDNFSESARTELNRQIEVHREAVAKQEADPNKFVTVEEPAPAEEGTVPDENF